MPIDLWLAYVLRLAMGIQTIQAPYAPVPFDRAVEYASAATYHGLRSNIDPYELVAVARNESDFIPNLRGPDGKDCGLTQTRTTITRFTCKQLLDSAWLDFAEAARELTEYRGACRRKSDHDRCRLNMYNSGVHYATTGTHGDYWLRVICFREAARSGVAVGGSCRHVHSMTDIARLLDKHRNDTPSLLATSGTIPSS